MGQIADAPLREPFVIGLPPIPKTELAKGVVAGEINPRWYDWLSGDLVARADAAPEFLGAVAIEGRGAAIGTTAIPLPSLGAGRYRISVFVKVRVPGTVSSSVTPTIGFTRDGKSCALNLPALTTNLDTSVDSREWIVRLDEAMPLTYAAAYASVGATAMTFDLDVVVEALR